MTIWESGRESTLLDDIIAGNKTIEGRLNRGKFALYKVGDVVKLRRDMRDREGVLRDGQPNAAEVKITAIRHYPNFLTMVQNEGYNNVIPDATSDFAAAQEYDNFYSASEQETHGVLAIEIALMNSAVY